jgi:5-methyltetrahydropteroyltriglutamate--homocysteine methyltransferase
MPVVTGPLRFQRSVAQQEVLFAKSVARRPLKTTVIGPVSLSRHLADHFYNDAEALILDLAAALNEEMRILQAAGTDVLQIDEPAWHFSLDLARQVGRRALTRMVEGISIPVVVHVCYGYAHIFKQKSPSPDYAEVLEILSGSPITGISLEYEQPRHDPSILKHCGDKHVLIGLLDLGNKEIETPAHVADRLRAALEVVPPERLHPCSDCGMWYLPRERAYGKIAALAAATRAIRDDLGIRVDADAL